jgi:hypothetical protein
MGDEYRAVAKLDALDAKLDALLVAEQARKLRAPGPEVA